jgi:hypothetical protein
LVLIRRPAPGTAWRTFGGVALVALVLAVVAVGLSLVIFHSNGTTRAMVSLLPQIIAGLSLVGALVCGVVAAVLRVAAGGSTSPVPADRQRGEP